MTDMSPLGIGVIVAFVLGMIGAAIFDIWKLKQHRKITHCKHMSWIDGEEILICIECGEIVHETR